MNVLSIQSWVAYGHVGNASAVFPLQRMGIEVWGVNTVQFSNHTGYGKWRGQVYNGDFIRDLVDGLDDLEVLSQCDAVLSGYTGDADIGVAILDAVSRVRAENGNAVYLCDPVIGDIGRGVFVRPGIPEFMRELAVPAADIVTPNHFELEFLSGVTVKDMRTLRKALEAIHQMGPGVIMVTSLNIDQTPDNSVDIIVSTQDGLMRVRTPHLSINVNGAGDAIASLFLGKYLKEFSARDALEHAASAIFGLLRHTQAKRSREILIVEAQDEFVNPTTRFTVDFLD